MGRINYSVRLIIRLLFVLLCFVVAFLFTAIGYYQTDEVELTNSAELPYCNITTKNGATAQCSVEKGLLVLDIVQDSGEYDDIVLTLKTAPFKYNTAFLESVMGSKSEYTEYIENMKKGPWSANLNYRLMGDSVLTKGDKHFTLKYHDDVFTNSLSSKAANTNDSSADLIVFENDEFTLDIIMGTNASGSLPTGRYYLFAELNVSGLYGEDNPQLSLLESIPGFLKISIDALKTVNAQDVFNVSSWLTFYFVMVVFGCLFFAYPDMRAAFRMATADKSDIHKVTYYIYINGCYSGEAYEYVGTAAFSLIGFIIAYLILIITIPLRIIAQVINCIVRIIRGDDYEDCDPIYANIIGSIGVYAALTAIIGLINALMNSGNFVIVVISGIIGIILLIIANILSIRKEDEM